MLEKKQEKKNKKESSKDQNYIDNALKEMAIDLKQSRSSKSSLSSFLQGKGFQYLAGYTQSQTQIVKRQYAEKTFLRMLQSCAEHMTENAHEINNYKNYFKQIVTYDFQRKIIPHVIGTQKQIKILCIDLCKKPKVAFMSYTVMKYKFEMSPNIMKQSIQNSFSMSWNFPILGWSSNKFDCQERMLKEERGMTPQDLGMMIQLANVDNAKKLMVLQLFREGQFENIDY